MRWNSSTVGDWPEAADWTGGEPGSARASASIASQGTCEITMNGGETIAMDNVSLDAVGDAAAGSLMTYNALSTAVAIVSNRP